MEPYRNGRRIGSTDAAGDPGPRATVLSATDVALATKTTITGHKKAADRFASVASAFAFFYQIQLPDGADLATQTGRCQGILFLRKSALEESPPLPRWAKRDPEQARKPDASKQD